MSILGFGIVDGLRIRRKHTIGSRFNPYHCNSLTIEEIEKTICFRRIFFQALVRARGRDGSACLCESLEMRAVLGANARSLYLASPSLISLFPPTCLLCFLPY